MKTKKTVSRSSTICFKPGNEELDGLGRAQRHVDPFLQTPHRSERLHKRLLSLYFDARTYQEEQGVNILYLAMGFLRLYEDNESDKARWAPLILVPVSLARDSVGDRFKLSYKEEEITTNLSLQEKLRHDFGLEIPKLPDTDDISPAAYFQKVRQAISGRPRWEVEDNDMVLGFFSFSKFLMYRDLDPQNWPGASLEHHKIINSLLLDGFSEQDPLFREKDKLDTRLQPENIFHVLDCDSSQSIAIEEVRNGTNLVIQGPPGTGKSQTITNLIASAVQDSKTVLFLAEKMAALEVVKRRLENIELGSLCLELHSHKANKKQVLADLAETLDLGQPQISDSEKSTKDLQKVRDELNEFVEKLHKRIEPSFLTPYRLLGMLVKTSALDLTSLNMEFSNGLTWSYDDIQEREEKLTIFANAIKQVGTPAQFPWRGIRLEVALPDDLTKIKKQMEILLRALASFVKEGMELSRNLKLDQELSLATCNQMASIGKRISQSPDFDYTVLKSKTWEINKKEIFSLIKTGLDYEANKEEIDSVFSEIAWNANLVEIRIEIAARADSFLRFFIPSYWKARSFLKGIMRASVPKTDQECLVLIDKLMRAQKAKSSIRERASLGQESFGKYWQNENSPWSSLKEAGEWNDNVRADYKDHSCLDIANDRAALPEIMKKSKAVEESAKRLRSDLSELFEFIKLDIDEAFGAGDIESISMKSLLERLKEWLQDPESITKWIGFQNSWKSVNALDLESLSQKAYHGEIEPSRLRFQFRHILYTQIFRNFAQINPEFGSFDGDMHMQKLDRFRDLDKHRIEIARQIVAATHYEGIPKGHQSIGGLGTIKSEIQKKRRHLPVRRLLKQADRAVQAIKPVFMMSPMSVA